MGFLRIPPDDELIVRCAAILFYGDLQGFTRRNLARSSPIAHADSVIRSIDECK
jgi:hypothetical protein